MNSYMMLYTPPRCNVNFYIQLSRLDTTIRKVVITKLIELSRGYWENMKSMKRPTYHLHKSIKLNRSNFSKGGRIVWEEAISYSAKKKCYVDVIRIWAIISDHDKQNETLKRIEDSHRKGQASNVFKLMKFRFAGQSLDMNQSNTITEVHDEEGKILSIPQQYEVISEQSSSFMDRIDINNTTENNCHELRTWYPPAVPSADSYVLLKFYECTKGLLRLYYSDLTEDNANIDFPFRLSPLEQDICDLRPNPSSSILLLGRSGTGT